MQPAAQRSIRGSAMPQACVMKCPSFPSLWLLHFVVVAPDFATVGNELSSGRRAASRGTFPEARTMTLVCATSGLGGSVLLTDGTSFHIEEHFCGDECPWPKTPSFRMNSPRNSRPKRR